jgi:predicted DNA binding protein
MSVIAELRIPAADFELGRLLDLSGRSSVELETMVPIGDGAAPFVWAHDVDSEQFAARLRSREAVERVAVVDSFEHQTLYALDWNVECDRVLSGVHEQRAQILRATGSADEWRFELRFPDHESLSAFQRHSEEVGVSLSVVRVYHPSTPDAGPWFGLTEQQREALMLAVEMGYYDVPRRCTTIEVASELDISDQALTERLRRGITSLTRNTLFARADTAGD